MNLKKLTILGLLLANALVLSYVESLFGFYIGIPGAKLGLANLVTLLLLYTYGAKEAVIMNLLRILMTGFLFSGLFGIIYSIVGAGFSFMAMYLVKKTGKFSILGVSITGGVTHNIGQLMVAMILMGNQNVIFYLPVLLIAGTVTGMILGYIGALLLPYLKKLTREDS